MDLKKISDLDSISMLSDDDEFVIVDKSVVSGKDASTSGKTSKILFETLKEDVISQATLANLAGEKGAPGQIGLKGYSGKTGSQGMYGIRGQTGNYGDIGEQGSKGFVGGKGSKGERGDAGNTGATGIQGELGTVGTRGRGGDAGDIGEIGNEGLSGDKGQLGLKGNKGNKGSPAPTIEGTPGDIGDPGETTIGAKGYKGFRGFASNVQGQRGPRGNSGQDFNYDATRRSFKEDMSSPYRHGRILSFMLSAGGSSSISVTTNQTMLEQIRERRFLVFELSNENNNLGAEKYSNLFVEVDFEPFSVYNQSPVLVKVCPIFTKIGDKVGTLAMDWFLDSSGDFHIMFFGIFTDTHETIQIPIKSVYTFTSNHLSSVVSGEYKNLRI